MRPDGGPAFPGTKRISGPSFVPGKASVEVDVSSIGMSLRDYFAAHAPAEYLGVMAAKVQEAGDNDTEVATIMAAAAFMYADAMLAERDKS